MFSLSTSSPCEFQGTLRFKKRLSGLGNYTDVDGVTWDIHGIFSGGEHGLWVQAVKQDSLHPYWGDTSDQSYSDTTGCGPYDSTMVSQRWMPYKVEIVGNE